MIGHCRLGRIQLEKSSPVCNEAAWRAHPIRVVDIRSAIRAQRLRWLAKHRPPELRVHVSEPRTHDGVVRSPLSPSCCDVHIEIPTKKDMGARDHPFGLKQESYERIDLSLPSFNGAGRAKVRVVELHIPIARDVYPSQLHIASDFKIDPFKDFLCLDGQEGPEMTCDLALAEEAFAVARTSGTPDSHATRRSYGWELTPFRIRCKSRALSDVPSSCSSRSTSVITISCKRSTWTLLAAANRAVSAQLRCQSVAAASYTAFSVRILSWPVLAISAHPPNGRHRWPQGTASNHEGQCEQHNPKMAHTNVNRHIISPFFHSKVTSLCEEIPTL
jgi:hypothetical protein